MPKYTLHYFNAKGRAEFSRLIFTAAGVEFTDRRFKEGEWAQEKNNFPGGVVPALEIDGKLYGESVCIARYLANEFCLAGKTNLEKFHADIVVAILMDFMGKILDAAFMTKDETEKAAKMEKLKTETFPNTFVRLNGMVGDGGFFAGDSITWADLLFVYVGDTLHEYALLPAEGEEREAFHKKIPNLPALRKKVVANEKIAAYRAAAAKK